jgi:hypothetical protein
MHVMGQVDHVTLGVLGSRNEMIGRVFDRRVTTYRSTAWKRMGQSAGTLGNHHCKTRSPPNEEHVL